MLLLLFLVSSLTDSYIVQDIISKGIIIVSIVSKDYLVLHISLKVTL